MRIFYSVVGAIGRCVFTQRARGWKASSSASAASPSWLIVGCGAGIALWFGLDGPEEWLAVLCLGAGLAIAGFFFEGGRLERAIGWLGLALALGCGLIWLRSEWVRAPRLERPMVTAFDANVEKVEPIASKGDLRLTLAPQDSALPDACACRQRQRPLRPEIDWQSLVQACAQADIAVSDRWLPRSCSPRWLKLDRKALEQTGGVALYLDGKPRLETVSEQLAGHPWAM